MLQNVIYKHEVSVVKYTTIIEKISWDARSILVVVFLTASVNFRQCFSNYNVHVA